MRKRRIYLALVGLGIVIGGIVLLSRPEREPEYGGKKLSEWVKRYGDGRFPPGVDFVREYRWTNDPIYCIGTNAIPYLLEWQQYKQPAWKHSLFARINFVLGKVNADWGIADHRRLQAIGSKVGFCILGPASGCIPEVNRIANDPKTPPEFASQAARALEALRYGRIVARGERLQRQISQERVLRQTRSNALERAAAP